MERRFTRIMIFYEIVGKSLRLSHVRRKLVKDQMETGVLFRKTYWKTYWRKK